MCRFSFQDQDVNKGLASLPKCFHADSAFPTWEMFVADCFGKHVEFHINQFNSR